MEDVLLWSCEDFKGLIINQTVYKNLMDSCQNNSKLKRKLKDCGIIKKNLTTVFNRRGRPKKY